MLGPNGQPLPPSSEPADRLAGCLFDARGPHRPPEPLSWLRSRARDLEGLETAVFVVEHLHYLCRILEGPRRRQAELEAAAGTHFTAAAAALVADRFCDAGGTATWRLLTPCGATPAGSDGP